MDVIVNAKVAKFIFVVGSIIGTRIAASFKSQASTLA